MIFCADDFNMGAMENKGLNIFNSKLVLARPETATDDDYQAIESVIGHEYFHNWTGNRVTCRDWFQLSLKEGLTVFRDQEFSTDMQLARGRAHRRRRVPAHPPVPRGRRADGASGAARRVHRDQQLLHDDRLRKGRRGHPHAADAARPRGLPARHGPLLRAPRRPGGHLRRLRAGDGGRERRAAARPRAVPPLVRPGRHAGGHARAAATIRRAGRTRSRSGSTRRPRPGSRTRRRSTSRFAVGLRRPRRPRPAADAGRRTRAWRDDARARRHAQRAELPFRRRPARPVPSLLRGFSAPVRLEYRPHAGRPGVPRRPRQRPGQPLGRGAAQLRRRHPAARRARSRRASRRRCRRPCRRWCRRCSATRRAIRHWSRWR